MTEAELVGRWTAAADEVALAFAGEDNDRVEAALNRMRNHIVQEFAALFPQVPIEVWTAGAETIIEEIRRRRREIESENSTRILN